MSAALPQGAAIIVLGPSALPLAHKIKAVLPGARLHAPAARRLDADVHFARAAPHIAALFAAGTPIVGLCAAGILIRAVAPLLDDKAHEPPVVAVAEDGSSAVPLLGGHRGANALACAIAELAGGHAAITTAPNSPAATPPSPPRASCAWASRWTSRRPDGASPIPSTPNRSPRRCWRRSRWRCASKRAPPIG